MVIFFNSTSCMYEYRLQSPICQFYEGLNIFVHIPLCTLAASQMWIAKNLVGLPIWKHRVEVLFFRSRTDLTDHIGACNPELAAATGQVVEFSPSSRRKLVHAYHLNKTTIFMPENKAHRIISSYIVFVSKAG